MVLCGRIGAIAGVEYVDVGVTRTVVVVVVVVVAEGGDVTTVRELVELDGVTSPPESEHPEETAMSAAAAGTTRIQRYFIDFPDLLISRPF